MNKHKWWYKDVFFFKSSLSKIKHAFRNLSNALKYDELVRPFVAWDLIAYGVKVQYFDFVIK